MTPSTASVTPTKPARAKLVVTSTISTRERRKGRTSSSSNLASPFWKLKDLGRGCQRQTQEDQTKFCKDLGLDEDRLSMIKLACNQCPRALDYSDSEKAITEKDMSTEWRSVKAMLVEKGSEDLVCNLIAELALKEDELPESDSVHEAKKSGEAGQARPEPPQEHRHDQQFLQALRQKSEIQQELLHVSNVLEQREDELLTMQFSMVELQNRLADQCRLTLQPSETDSMEDMQQRILDMQFCIVDLQNRAADQACRTSDL